MTSKSPSPPKPPSPPAAPATPEQARCKERFESFRKNLAQPVRDALDKREFEDAISLAIIHNGIRDKYKLADMIYLEKHGPTRGYCKIKKGDYVSKGNYDEILLNLVVPRVKEIPSRQLPQEGGVDCVARQVYLDKKPQPDNPTDDLTGRYEGALRMDSGDKLGALLVNQAGRHIECAFVVFIGSKSSATERPTYRFYGDQQKDGSFSLFTDDDPSKVLFLRSDPRTKEVTLGVGRSRGLPFYLTTLRPTIPGKVIELIDTAAKRIQRYERYPLQQAQAEYIMERMQPENIEPLLRFYFSVAPGSRTVEKSEMRQAAQPMSTYMIDTINAIDNPSLSTHRVDYPLAQYYAQTVLSISRWEHKGIIRSHLDWIQIMVGTLTAASGSSNEAAYISALTGVRTWKPGDPGVDQKPYKYRVTLKLYGGGFIGAGYYGSMTVEQIAPAPWPGGKESFSVYLLGAAVIALKPGHEIEGEAESYLPWEPPDFPGLMNMVSGAVGYMVDAEAGWMFLYGSETKLPLQVLFAKAEIKPKDILKKGKLKKKLLKVLPTIDLSGVWGKVRDRSFSKIDYSTAMEKMEYANVYDLTKAVFFCLDSALLTPAARQFLRWTCAIEQAAFQSPNSHLTIIGHTDRSGPKIDRVNYNLRLSNFRAQNTLKAIRDILGTKYAIPEDHEIILGKGEEEAAQAAKAGNSPEINPKFRRVDIILNCRLVLTLKTP